MKESANIHTWLDDQGLGDLATVFRRNDITPDMLPQLTVEDMVEMGITSLEHRKELLAAIADLRQPAVGGARTPQPLSPRGFASVPEPSPVPTPSIAPPNNPGKPGRKRKAFSASFLTVSICVHLVLILGAGYWVVQRVEAKRKLQFTSAPPTPNPSKRAMEHKVSLQKKKNAGGAPAQAKRIAVTGLAAKITLPEMPSVPTTSTQFVTGRMASMGGAGFGSGLGVGNGSGMGVGGMGAGGLGLTMFGTRGGAEGLIGTLYDLKQTKDRKPTDMGAEPGEGMNIGSTKMKRYREVMTNFVKTWDPAILGEYYSAPGKLATTQLFIPKLRADEAPKAFKVEKECEPRRWAIHYRGVIVAPRDGKFRFVGAADDVLVVRINGINILDGSHKDSLLVPEVNESSNVGPALDQSLVAGKWIQMRRGEAMKMEALVGENPGGGFLCFLMIEEQGVDHPPGVFPVFQLRAGEIPTGIAPGHHGSIIFGSRAVSGGSPLNSFKRP